MGNSFTTTSASSPSGNITVQNMRDAVRYHLLGTGSQFADSVIDYNAKFIFNEAIRRTRCTTTQASITLAADTETVDITSTITNWRAKWWVAGEIDYYPVEIVDYRRVADAYAGGSTVTGVSATQPRLIGFRTDSRALIYPTVSAETTMTVFYWQPLVSWTTGNANDTTELNIPEELLFGMIKLGVTPSVVDNAPNEPLARGGWWYDFIQWCDEVAPDNEPNHGPTPMGTHVSGILNFNAVSNPS